MVIIYSNRFKAELKTIVDFISQDSSANAIKFKKELLEKIKILKHSPFIGRIRNKKMRDYIFKSYVIPYYVKNDEVLLIGIYKENIWE